MYDTYIMRRTQIYLNEAQAQELARRSTARGVTMSHVIREAIGQYLSADDDDATELGRQRVMLREAFGTIPRLPRGDAYVEEQRHTDHAREDRLEDRWRSR